MPADVGTQEVTLKYYDPANSSEVNARFKDIRQLGIYSGGRLTVTDGPNHKASLSPLVCEISDGTHQVKVETTIAITNITVLVATPYLVLRWTYAGATSDYMEVLTVATPSANDLVVGKRNAAGNLTGFDYGDTSYPRSTPNTQDLFLKVEPTEATELKVRIRVGCMQTEEKVVTIPDQKSTTITAPSANSKIYLVYVSTADGTIQIDTSGSEAASPVAPDYDGKMVLAEITLASTDTNITADKIKDVRSFLASQIILDGETITYDSSGKLVVNYNIDDFEVSGGKLALKQSLPDGFFGVKTNLDSLGSALVQNVVYKASSDGFVSASCLNWQDLYFQVGGTSNPTDIVARGGNWLDANWYDFIFYPITKGEYIRLRCTNLNSMWFKPMGTGALVKQ